MNPKSRPRRVLNVIYFIDAHKTRSFHLSLHKFYIILGTLAFLSVWTLFSIYFVLRSLDEKEALRDRLHTALATTFEYQSRYDSVYESAYPELQAKKDLLAAAAASAQDEGAGRPTAESRDEKKDSSSDEEAQNLNRLSFEKLELETTDSQWPIAIEDLSIHRDEQDLELSFAIRNKKSPSRSEGYIWAVATLVDAAGKSSFVASPPGLKVDPQLGKVSEPSKHANWYSIRYYKAKSFYFSLPPNWSGKINEIKLGMMDTSGKQSEVKVPLLNASEEPSKSATSTLAPTASLFPESKSSGSVTKTITGKPESH